MYIIYRFVCTSTCICTCKCIKGHVFTIINLHNLLWLLLEQYIGTIVFWMKDTLSRTQEPRFIATPTVPPIPKSLIVFLNRQDYKSS